MTTPIYNKVVAVTGIDPANQNGHDIRVAHIMARGSAEWFRRNKKPRSVPNKKKR